MKTVQENGVSVSAKPNRILAFDLLRGYFLMVIMIDHIELYPNILDFFTGKGRLFVSAAEGFFFLSGLLIGIVYKRRLALGTKFIFGKIWRRAFQLYLGSIVLTLFYVALAVYTHRTGVKYGLPVPMDWDHVLKETFLLRFAFGWSDFLARFAILMIFAPFVFYLVSKGRWWLVAIASLIAWHFRGNGFTLSWQIIFNAGIIIGFHWESIINWLKSLQPKTKRYLQRSTYAIAGVTFAVSYLSVYLLSLLNHIYGDLTPWLRHLTYTWNNYNYDVWVYAQKWTMGPLRIVLFFLWFSALFMLVEKFQSQINDRSRGILELLGRNSLFVYIAHSFIVFVFKMFIPTHTDVAQNFLITAMALVLLIVVTVFYKAFTGGSGFNRPDKFSRRVSRKSRSLIASGLLSSGLGRQRA